MPGGRHQFSKGAPSAEGNLLLSLSRAAISSFDSRHPNAPEHSIMISANTPGQALDQGMYVKHITDVLMTSIEPLQAANPNPSV